MSSATASEHSSNLAQARTATAPLLKIRNLAKRFGNHVVLRDIALEVAH